MSDDWNDMTLREFQTALASSSPTPGGGTAAAVALGQAAALTCMVSDLTLGKERYEEGWNIAEKARDVAIPILTRSAELAIEDSAAFDMVMACFKMPKQTEEEIQLRRTAIRETTLGAAEVPFETAELALELLKTLPELAKKGNPNAVSDVGVASLLASAACKGALFNVEINLGSLPSEMAEEMRESMPTVQEDVRKYSREAMDEVRIVLSD